MSAGSKLLGPEVIRPEGGVVVIGRSVGAGHPSLLPEREG